MIEIENDRVCRYCELVGKEGMGSGEALVASGICGQYDDLGKVESKVLGINGVVSAIERYRIEAEGRGDVEIGSVVEAGGITGMVGSIENDRVCRYCELVGKEGMGSGEALVASGICGQYDDLGKASNV